MGNHLTERTMFLVIVRCFERLKSLPMYSLLFVLYIQNIIKFLTVHVEQVTDSIKQTRLMKKIKYFDTEIQCYLRHLLSSSRFSLPIDLFIRNVKNLGEESQVVKEIGFV